MINGMILILMLLIFRSLMAMSLGVLLTVYIYISQLIRFARALSYVNDFNNHNKFLKKPNSLSKAIGIINSAKRFPNVIVGTLIISKHILSV